MRLFLSVCLLSLLSFGFMSIAEGHSKEITQCKGNIVYKEAVLVKGPYILESNGLIAEEYDTNKDGVTDVMTLSHPKDWLDIKHDEHPVFWFVDLDFDGEPDAVYVDKNGLGKCTDIVLYEDLTKPMDHSLVNPKKPLRTDQGGKL